MINADSKNEQTLESIVDGHGIREVLNALVNICSAKAEHLQHNWQDKNSARVWRNRAVAIMNTADRTLFDD